MVGVLLRPGSLALIVVVCRASHASDGYVTKGLVKPGAQFAIDNVDAAG